MKVCPHCDTSFPESMDRCPQCGTFYWDDQRENTSDAAEYHDEEEQGCFSLLIFHLLIALALAVVFVLFGFVVNLLVHFEANQIKIAWISGSLLLGGILSCLIRKLRRKQCGKGPGGNARPGD